MWILVNISILVTATLIAGAAAVGVYWLLLRATLELMRPAVAPVAALRQQVARKTSMEGSK